MRQRISLNTIGVKTPCDVPWAGMQGDGKVRFCSQCQRHVHNLSEMSADEAERLVCQAAGELCIRFSRDRNGGVVTLDYQPACATRHGWKFWAMVTACAGTALAAAYAIHVIRRPVYPTLTGDLMIMTPDLDDTAASEK
jgi:hypothetical protein